LSTAAEPDERPGPAPVFPTHRGGRTQAAIDMAEAGRSAGSFYDYYDSKEAMVHEIRALPITFIGEPGGGEPN
jgi:Bacterial regulatory proteins, tetR family